MYSASPKLSTAQPATNTNKSSKWQPLSAVEPSPVGENDPFSLGDSDDEKDAKPIVLKDDESKQVTGTTSPSTSTSTQETGAKKATVEDGK